MNDELLSILRQIQDYPLSGERVKTERKPEPPAEKDRSFNRALKTAVLLMYDGTFHPLRRIQAIASLYRVDLGLLLETLEPVEYSPDRTNIRLEPFEIPNKKRGNKK